MEFAAGVNEPEASAASISRQANKESSFGSSCVHCTDDIDAMCKTLGATIVFTCNIRKHHVQHYGFQGMEAIPKRVGNHTL